MFIIKNIGRVSSKKIEDTIEELFGAVVIVDIVSTSTYCFSTRSAILTVTSSSIELQKFIRYIDQHGSNTFCMNKVVYTVTREVTPYLPSEEYI